jgi:hypothetical protein
VVGRAEAKGAPASFSVALGGVLARHVAWTSPAAGFVEGPKSNSLAAKNKTPAFDLG